MRQCELQSDPPSNITLHTYRHTFGSSLAIEGVPLRAIQKPMGHTVDYYNHKVCPPERGKSGHGGGKDRGLFTQIVTQRSRRRWK